MTPREFTEADEVATHDSARPHVVLIGAGASLAALPNGDKSGRPLPLMSNLVKIIGLEPLLQKASVPPPYTDFEAVYARLCSDPACQDTSREVEIAIFDYFSSLELPDRPTLYDHLVLALRPKDVIATFNWDPFLWQAAFRNRSVAQPPRLVFLHGNVAIGFCSTCHIKGLRGTLCPSCKTPYEQSRLLYPITQKNYNADSLISAEWAGLRGALSSAYIFTIFGYGAPSSDVEAVDLMSAAWGPPEKRQFEEIELIDILDTETLATRWQRFIHTHHYRTPSSFYDSLLSRHPRRSCEALWAMLMEIRFAEGTRIPEGTDFESLYAFFRPRIEMESAS